MGFRVVRCVQKSWKERTKERMRGEERRGEEGSEKENGRKEGTGKFRRFKKRRKNGDALMSLCCMSFVLEAPMRWQWPHLYSGDQTSKRSTQQVNQQQQQQQQHRPREQQDHLRR